MFRTINQNLAVTMESSLDVPHIYEPSYLAATAKSVLELFKPYNLQASQVQLRTGDQLFNYELSFPLFNNQAQFRLNSERLSLNIQNGRNLRDLQTIWDCCTRAVQCFPENALKSLNINALSHSTFQSKEAAQQFFSQFVNLNEGIIDGGKIINVHEEGWPITVRLSIERSLGFADGVFANWSTLRMGAFGVEILSQITDIFDKSAQKAGLEIKFENENTVPTV